MKTRLLLGSLLWLTFLENCKLLANESDFANFPCNIEKLYVEKNDALLGNIEDFPDNPVVFVGARDRNRALAEAASLEALRMKYGDTIVTLASSNSYSHDTVDMMLSEYLDMLQKNNHINKDAKANETYYLFGNNFSELFKKLEGHYVLPPCSSCKEAGAVTVGIGGYRSGVSFHFHGPGFSEVISGRKLFFLYPPDLDINVDVPPNLTMSQWVDEIYPTLEKKTVNISNVCNDFDSTLQGMISDSIEKANGEPSTAFENVRPRISSLRTVESFYECVLEPGDMLYFPNNWQHATLNLDDYNLFVSLFLDLQLLQKASRDPNS